MVWGYKYSMSIPEELIDAYAKETEIAVCKFNMMGRLLDSNYVKTRVELLKSSELYIYGGGYLGIQLYRSINNLVRIPSIIDQGKKLSVDIGDIPVIDVPELERVYKGQKIIVTPIAFFQEIRKELLPFVAEKEIVFLGEFLGGFI